jgi:hypothetical protein
VDAAASVRRDAPQRGLDLGRGDFWVTGARRGRKTALAETAAGLRSPAGRGDAVRDAGGHSDRVKARATRRRIGFVYGGGGRLLGMTLANIALRSVSSQLARAGGGGGCVALPFGLRSCGRLPG